VNASAAFIRVLDTNHRHDTVTLDIETDDGEAFTIQYAAPFGETVGPMWHICNGPPATDVHWLEQAYSGEDFVGYCAETADSLAAVRIAHDLKQEIGGDDAVFVDASTLRRTKTPRAYVEEAGRYVANGVRKTLGAVAGAVR